MSEIHDSRRHATRHRSPKPVPASITRTALEKNLKGQASDELRAELKALVDQCRAALTEHADENEVVSRIFRTFGWLSGTRPWLTR